MKSSTFNQETDAPGVRSTSGRFSCVRYARVDSACTDQLSASADYERGSAIHRRVLIVARAHGQPEKCLVAL
jgi:hypothetical protein